MSVTPRETDWIGTIGGILGIDPDLVQSVRDQAKIEHLDFDPKCEATRQGKPCGAEADFGGHCRTAKCEGADGYMCLGCVTIARTLGIWHCMVCGVVGLFDDIHELYPLPGGAA